MRRKSRESESAQGPSDPAPDTSDVSDAEEVREDLHRFFESEDETWLDDLRDAETPQQLGGHFGLGQIIGAGTPAAPVRFREFG